jgi:NAD(P)-dependent dehydrogenase (short-subunit alcohol dehydrogenase family)
LAGELRKDGAEAAAVACDVCAEAEVDALVGETIARFGRADILVNNAGITKVVPAEEDSLASFEQVIDVNLKGVFLCAQRFGRVMLEAGGGSIVNVASLRAGSRAR